MVQENIRWLISTILAILAVLVPIVIFFVSTSNKTFNFEIQSKTEIAKETISVEGLKITINGEIVENIFVYGIKILNSGSEPIFKNDFEKMPSIYVSEGSKIYSAKKRKVYPENLPLDFKIQNSQLLISPMLLNPGDEFEIDFYSSSSEYPKIDARIAGIPKVNSTYPDSKKMFKKSLTAVVSFFLMVFYTKHLRLAIPKRNYNPKVLHMLNNAILGLSCGFASGQLFLYQFGIENKNTFIMLASIPMLIGFYYGYREIKYHK